MLCDNHKPIDTKKAISLNMIKKLWTTYKLYIQCYDLKKRGYRSRVPNKWQEKKEEIWLSSMTKAPTPTEKSNKERDNTKNATKNFDYSTIADRLRTVSWGKNSHPTGVVKPVYERSTFPLTATAMQSKQNRSTEGCSKLKCPDKRQVQERLVSTLEHMQVPKLDRTRCPEK